LVKTVRPKKEKTPLDQLLKKTSINNHLNIKKKYPQNVWDYLEKYDDCLPCLMLGIYYYAAFVEQLSR
jgi:hypothetical protein